MVKTLNFSSDSISFRHRRGPIGFDKPIDVNQVMTMAELSDLKLLWRIQVANVWNPDTTDYLIASASYRSDLHPSRTFVFFDVPFVPIYLLESIKKVFVAEILPAISQWVSERTEADRQCELAFTTMKTKDTLEFCLTETRQNNYHVLDAFTINLSNLRRPVAA